jgi:CRISPR-associated protein Cas1
VTVAMPGLPPPRPIPIKDRASILFLEKGRLDVLDGAFVLVDEAGCVCTSRLVASFV